MKKIEVVVSNQIVVKHPNANIMTWCENNLIYDNPEYSKKVKLGFSTYKVPKKVNFYEYDEKGNLVLPFGLLRRTAPYLLEAEKVNFKFSPRRHIDYKSTIELFDYQEEAVKELIKKRLGILESKAGSGKTQMGLELIARLGMKALWLTHTKDLLKQSKERATEFMDSSLFGEISEGKVNIGEGITFATVQTLAKQDLSKLKNEWDLVVVDECHRICGTPEKMQQFSCVLNSLAAMRKYGLSATIHRGDGLVEAIFAYVGDIAYSVPESAIKDKVLDPIIIKRETNIKVSQDCFLNNTVDYPLVIKELINDDERNKLIVSDLIANKEHHNLILSSRLSQLEKIMAMLPKELQKQSALIDGKVLNKVKKAEREQSIQDMRDGKLKYLFATYKLAKEGLDIVCLDRLYMALPQNDYAVVIQSVGRIARAQEGKAQPYCYDYVDNCDYLEYKFSKRLEHYNLNNYKICVKRTKEA